MPETPGPGQESVWDYPRPPRLERTASAASRWCSAAWCVARTADALRVLETSHPPTYYLPGPASSTAACGPRRAARSASGRARRRYLDVRRRRRGRARRARPGTTRRPPRRTPSSLDHVALYPGAMDRCTVDGEVVRPQPGGFYGGWVTSRVVGPFKGDPGTMVW